MVLELFPQMLATTLKQHPKDIFKEHVSRMPLHNILKVFKIWIFFVNYDK